MATAKKHAVDVKIGEFKFKMSFNGIDNVKSVEACIRGIGRPFARTMGREGRDAWEDSVNEQCRKVFNEDYAGRPDFESRQKLKEAVKAVLEAYTRSVDTMKMSANPRTPTPNRYKMKKEGAEKFHVIAPTKLEEYGTFATKLLVDTLVLMIGVDVYGTTAYIIPNDTPECHNYLPLPVSDEPFPFAPVAEPFPDAPVADEPLIATVANSPFPAAQESLEEEVSGEQA